MNKNLILLFTSLLIFFTACSDDAVDSKSEELQGEKKVESLTPKEATKPKGANDLLKDMGFDLGETKVAIDINKTSHFFEQLEIEMHGKVDEIERKIENAEINFTKGIGIEVTKDKIDIDLNKTRNMLQEINILMKDILLDGNHTID
jgi:hypothetical protein